MRWTHVMYPKADRHCRARHPDDAGDIEPDGGFQLVRALVIVVAVGFVVSGRGARLVELVVATASAGMILGVAGAGLAELVVSFCQRGREASSSAIDWIATGRLWSFRACAAIGAGVVLLRAA